MGKKIREQDVDQWLHKGSVHLLEEHWRHPVVVAYRKKKIESVSLYPKSRNEWLDNVRNGATFSFLMQHDPEFRKNHAGMNRFEWFNKFDKVYKSSWGLLDIATDELKGANAVETLELLTREGQTFEGEYANENVIRMVRAKLEEEMHDFYCRFQKRGALTAVAWMDNEDVWTHQRPRMANMMRHAASHNPNDVLGAYLVWACDAGCKSTIHEKQDKAQNSERMQQLRVLAERVGLDTTSYDEHAYHCKTIHEGLGMELNGRNVFVYAQSTNMASAPLVEGDELGSLFL